MVGFVLVFFWGGGEICDFLFVCFFNLHHFPPIPLISAYTIPEESLCSNLQ